MDADLQAMFDNPEANIGNKLFCIQLQGFRDFQAGIAAAGSEENFDADFKRTLYTTCLEKACDLRRQSMSTSTTLATEDDIINDIGRIATRLYDQALAKASAL
jgi:hypothetical protein